MKQSIEVDEANFDREVLRSFQPVLVDFWADWCGDCKIIAPVLEELAAEHAGRLRVATVNVDENPVLARRYRIGSIPTLLYFANGLIWEQISDVTTKEAILSKLKALPSNVSPQLN